MRIRCICLISVIRIVDSMFSMGKDNKNKRGSLDEVISPLAKRQRVDETVETSQTINVLVRNEQKSSKYLGENASRGNPDLVIDDTTENCEDLDNIASEVTHKVKIEQHIEELLNNRKSAIEKDNSPVSAYYLIERYLQSVFGKTGELIENGKIDLATGLLDWFSDSKNVQKLELKRYDLTCGFLRVLLSILGFSKLSVSSRYDGLVTIRYAEGHKINDRKTNNTRNSNEDTYKNLDHLRYSIPHVDTVYIPGYAFAALLSKKGLDETKIYAVLTAWLRETKVERFVYSWELLHKNKIYSCIFFHNLSEEQKDDIIVVNVWRVAHIKANYKRKIYKPYFPFVKSKATNFKIVVRSNIAFDPSFIDGFLGNTSASKCEIIFMHVLDIYNFYCDNKEHVNVKNIENGVKLNNWNLFCNNLQECSALHPIRYVFWELDTKVSEIDISFLRYLGTVIETKKLKGLKRFTILFPSQDSKLETAAAFFEVFGNSDGSISGDSYKTLQDILIKYIELKTLEDLGFLNNNLQQLYITLDTVIQNSHGTHIKLLEVHFIYEDANSQGKNVLDINNFAINSDDMALISKIKVDKLNLRNVIFRWNISEKICLDTMVPDKESRWCGKKFSKNIRYTMTETEHKITKKARNRVLHNISSNYCCKKNALRKKCINSSPSDSWLSEEERKLALVRNNKFFETYEEYKTLWENISTEWIINGLEHFGKNKKHVTTNVSYEKIFDSSDDGAVSSLLS